MLPPETSLSGLGWGFQGLSLDLELVFMEKNEGHRFNQNLISNHFALGEDIRQSFLSERWTLGGSGSALA